MKRILLLVLALSFLIVFPGCAGEAPQNTNYPYTQYPEPAFVHGTLTSDLLTAEPGNFDRANRTGSCSFLETGSGYYYWREEYLYYAERENMNLWHRVCSSPDCPHTAAGKCSAKIEMGVYYSQDRLFFMGDLKKFSHLSPADAEAVGYMLCSMSTGGTDIRLAHIYKDMSVAAGAQSGCILPDGYVISTTAFHPDSTYTSRLYYYGKEGEGVFLEETQDELQSPITFSAAQLFSMYGDNAFYTSMEKDYPFADSFSWVDGSQLRTASVSALSARGGYLRGSILRCYRPNDGYYDVDLVTGKETKLADTQLQNAHAFILQPNCILESELFRPGMTLGLGEREPREEGAVPAVRFFDGQTWHTVALPEDILNLPTNRSMGVVALTSDCIIFSTNPDGTQRFYQMRLDNGEFKLEQCGTFTVQ